VLLLRTVSKEENRQENIPHMKPPEEIHFEGKETKTHEEYLRNGSGVEGRNQRGADMRLVKKACFM